MYILFFFSSRRRHTRCALVTGVQRVLFRSMGWESRFVDEAAFPAHLAKALAKLVDRAAIELVRGHDIAARLHKRVKDDDLGGEVGRSWCRVRACQDE